MYMTHKSRRFDRFGGREGGWVSKKYSFKHTHLSQTRTPFGPVLCHGVRLIKTESTKRSEERHPRHQL